MSEPRRVALVTGCGKREGIGAACARELARRGLAVAVSDVVPTGVVNTSERKEDLDLAWGGLDALVAELRDAGREAVATTGDVTLEEDAERMVAETVARFGRLDVLVNSAGAPQGPEYTDIERITLEAWRSMMAVNATGTFLMCRAAIPRMRAGGWGRIVNIASDAGRKGVPRQVVYSASKHAVVGMTRSMALDVAPDGITVNSVCPGPIRTSRALNSVRRAGAADLQAELAKRAAAVPVGRYGEPREVAALVAFLASEEAGFITASALPVNGGTLPV